MKVKTLALQEMLAKSIKGASNNKLIPLTSLIDIRLVGGNLTMITTDATNYLYTKLSAVEGEDMEVVVQADKLARLIAKMTSEFVEMKVTNSYLEVKGNGNYKIELPLDENGDMVNYPDPYAGAFGLNGISTQVELEVVKKILAAVKPSLAVTMEEPQYTGYYVGNSIIGTNREILTNYNVNLLQAEVLVSSELMNLLDLMTVDKFTAIVDADTLIFESPECVIYGKVQEGIEDFGVDAILSLMKTEFPATCKVPRNELLQVLDRLSLFVGEYEHETIKLEFMQDALEISSMSSSGVESIKYEEENDANPFTAYINIHHFMNQIKAQDKETVQIWYGLDSSIRLDDDKVTHIIALCEKSDD